MIWALTKSHHSLTAAAEGRQTNGATLSLSSHPSSPRWCETHLSWEEGTERGEGKRWLAHSRSINHRERPCPAKLKILPGTTLMVKEPRCHKSPGLCQRPRPLAQHKGGGYSAGTGTGVCPPMDTGPFCFPLGVMGGRGERSGELSWEPGPVAWQRWNVLGQLFVSSQKRSGDASYDQMT